MIKFYIIHKMEANKYYYYHVDYNDGSFETYEPLNNLYKI